jgi:hypothetical protein
MPPESAEYWLVKIVNVVEEEEEEEEEEKKKNDINSRKTT